MTWRFLDDEPIRARRTSASERVWRWCRRKPFDAVLVGTTAALLVVLAVGSTVAAVWINAERIRADAKAMGELAARKTAERTAEESRSRLVRLYINTGTSSAERGDVGPALLWYDRPGRRTGPTAPGAQPPPTPGSHHRPRPAAVGLVPMRRPCSTPSSIRLPPRPDPN
ncbi:MAG: hypothetical protein WKF75_18190 [Singulisphaera sp.]